MPEMTSVLTNTKPRKIELLRAISKKQAKQVAQLLKEDKALINDQISCARGVTTMPLAEAAAVGHKPTVQALLAAKADVNARREVPCACCDKTIAMNALFLAATRGHYRVVQLLIERPDVLLTGHTKAGAPALLVIARNHFWHGHAIVNLLLERELANPNESNMTCWKRWYRYQYAYPITQALVVSNHRIAASLLKYGASLLQAHKSLHQFKCKKHADNSLYFGEESWACGLQVLKQAWRKQQKETQSEQEMVSLIGDFGGVIS